MTQLNREQNNGDQPVIIKGEYTPTRGWNNFSMVYRDKNAVGYDPLNLIPPEDVENWELVDILNLPDSIPTPLPPQQDLMILKGDVTTPASGVEIIRLRSGGIIVTSGPYLDQLYQTPKDPVQYTQSRRDVADGEWCHY